MSSFNISRNEIFFLGVALTSYRIFTNLPLIFTLSSGTGAPLSALLSGILVLFVAFLFSGLLKKTDILTQSTFAIYPLSLILLVYLILSSAHTLSEFSSFAGKVAFPTTPKWFLALFLITAAGIGAFGKIKGVLILSKHFVTFFVIVIFLLLGSVLVQCNFENLFPLLGTSAQDTLFKGFSGIFLYTDMLLLLFISPVDGFSSGCRKYLLLGGLLGIFICFSVVLTYTAKIPYPLSREEQFPLYLLTKEVYYGRFFQRVDAIILLISALWGMLVLSFNLCLMSKILNEVFGITALKVVIFPLSALTFFLCGIQQGTVSTLIAVTMTILILCLTVFFIIKPKKEVYVDES